MPLPLETTIQPSVGAAILTFIPVQAPTVDFNSIYIPSITLTTVIKDGELKTSAVLVLKAANVTEYGVWSENSPTCFSTDEQSVVYIDDIMNLDSDISSVAPQIEQIFGGIIYLIAQVNAIRKLL